MQKAKTTFLIWKVVFVCTNFVEISRIKNTKIENFCLTTICLYDIIEL
jgi:hypothetical protein